MQAVRRSLLQTDVSYVPLKTSYLLGADIDSLSKGEIIPLSGVSKSGGASIIHAGGAGGFVR